MVRLSAKYDEPTDTSQENLAQTKKDMESLQGRWQSVKFSFFPDDKPGGKLIVKGNQIIFWDPKTGEELPGFPFHLDPKTKAFDLRIVTPFGIGEFIGLYELKGDDFRFYMQEEYGRAKAFDDKGVLPPVVVFKREKPTSPPELPKEQEAPPAKKSPPKQVNDGKNKADPWVAPSKAAT